MIRQGDVLLIPVSSIPSDCEQIQPEGGRLVLMFGEATGHAHAIYEDTGIAKAIAKQAIDRAAARSKARLLRAANGIRYLQVTEPVLLRHEEHTALQIPVGLYEIPVQVEFTGSNQPWSVKGNTSVAGYTPVGD